MRHSRRLTALVLAGSLAATSAASAQVYVRAPFVRVQTGGPGVSVRAPFVNLFVPTGPQVYGPPPVYVAPYEAPLEIVPPPAAFPPPPTAFPSPPTANLAPQAVVPAAPVAGVLTVEDFARTFQPRAGSYDVTLLNPITGQPNSVRFTLPAGTPRRVHVNRRSVEFDYGPRQFVRIEFDRHGAEVIAR